MARKVVFVLAVVLCLAGWGQAQVAGSRRSYSKASSVTALPQVRADSESEGTDAEEAGETAEAEAKEGAEEAGKIGEAGDKEETEKEAELPVPPPPLAVTVLGDTIYLKRGRPITHVIVLKQGVLEVQYEGFFDHPTNAHKYTASVSILDVDRVETTTKENHDRLRVAWDRKLAQVAAYKEQIKKSGLILFRGEYLTQSKINEILKREQDQLTQLRQNQATRRQTIQQAVQKRAESAARQRREQIAATIRPGQRAAVLNLLGPPSSRREMPLFNRVLQTEVVWQDLGIRVIVQNGIIAFIDRFSSGTPTTQPTRQPLAGRVPQPLATR